jgi:hypothetical protein
MTRVFTRAEIQVRAFESAVDQAINVAATRGGTAVSIEYDDAGNTFVVGANAQAALDSTDAALIGKQAADAQLTSIAGLAYAGNALKVVRVNAAEDAFELATSSGGGGGLAGTATVTLTTAAFQHTETVAAVGVTPAKTILVSPAPAVDADQNDPEMLDCVALWGTPGTDTITFGLTFSTRTVGPVKLNWSAV